MGYPQIQVRFLEEADIFFAFSLLGEDKGIYICTGYLGRELVIEINYTEKMSAQSILLFTFTCLKLCAPCCGYLGIFHDCFALFARENPAFNVIV